MSFTKKYEVYAPADLCWLEVIVYSDSKKVLITDDKTGATIQLCSSLQEGHQLQQLIDLLTHVGHANGLLKERS